MSTYPVATSRDYIPREPKICEHCGETFYRKVGSGVRFCPADCIPFPDPKRAVQQRRFHEENIVIARPSKTSHH